MEPHDAQSMTSIDVRLVKEQLRLLGHTVDDAVILSFVEGLGAGAAASTAAGQSHAESCSSEFETELDHDTVCSNNDSSKVTPQEKGAAVSASQQAQHAITSVVPEVTISDASPSRSQTDQLSPGSHGLGFTPPTTYNTLDQRCRKFLARLSERPSSQQLLHQYQQHKSMADRQLLSGKTELQGHVDPPSDPQHRAHSRCDDTGECSEGQLAHGHTSLLSSGKLSTSATTTDAVHCSMQKTECCTSAAASGHIQLTAVYKGECSRSTSDMQCLTHMNSNCSQGKPQPNQQPSHQERRGVQADTQLGRSFASEPVQNPDTTVPAAPSKLDQGSQVVYEAPTVKPITGGGQELPRFGFRPGYRPLGIHIPPPLAPDDVEFIRQAKETAAGAALNSIVSCQQQRSPAGNSPSGLQHPTLAPWLDVRPYSDSIIGDLAPMTSDRRDAAQRARHTPRHGSSSADPLYLAPTSPTCISPPATTEPPISRSPAKVIVAAVAAHNTSMRLTQKTLEVACPSAEHPCRSRGSNKSSGSCASDQRRRDAYISTAAVQSTRRASNNSVLSSQALYSQQLSFGGRCGRSSAVAPGVQKTDRVARFHQMQQQWQKDRFLSGGVGGSSRIRPSSSSSAQGHV